jgi:hypothetical protein
MNVRFERPESPEPFRAPTRWYAASPERSLDASPEDPGATTPPPGVRAAHVRRHLVPRLAASTALGVAILAAVGPVGAGSSTPAVSAPAGPTITILSPRDGAPYPRGSRTVARFRCREDGSTSGIASCRGTVPRGHVVDTRSVGTKSFTVTATDTSGRSVTQTVHYRVCAYVNPLRAVAGLHASRIDMGVDYSGSGPILAIGKAKVITARYVPGPASCWGRTCAPAPGGWVVYRLLDGPFAGKYVYAVENITVMVKAGQIVRQGQRVAVLHPRSPNLEIGWAAGRNAETFAVARKHECSGADPGCWSSIEGRNFNSFLVWLGAPSGFLQQTPRQRMPRGWPRLPPRA